MYCTCRVNVHVCTIIHVHTWYKGVHVPHMQTCKGMEELDVCHKKQHSVMTDDIKVEMEQFQKKVLTEKV